MKLWRFGHAWFWTSYNGFFLFTDSADCSFGNSHSSRHLARPNSLSLMSHHFPVHMALLLCSLPHWSDIKVPLTSDKSDCPLPPQSYFHHAEIKSVDFLFSSKTAGALAIINTHTHAHTQCEGYSLQGWWVSSLHHPTLFMSLSPCVCQPVSLSACFALCSLLGETVLLYD